MGGLTEAQVAGFGLSVGVSAFMAYMLFIIWRLAQDSKAGRFGTFVLFLALGFGMIGFIAKGLVKWWLGA